MPVLLVQGLELLLYGMGTVVAFLALLVLALRLMALALRTWFPEPDSAVADSQRTQPAAGAPRTDPSPELLAAIAAAVYMHRQRRSLPPQDGQSVR